MIYISVMFLMIVTILIYVNYIRIRDLKLGKRFNGGFYNFLYMLSYSIPLVYLIENDTNLAKKKDKIGENIHNLNLDDKFSPRSFITLKYLLFFFVVLMFFAVAFTLKSVTKSFSIIDTFPFLAVCMLIALTPDLYLNIRRKQIKSFYENQAVLLQLFTILMVKSSATIEDILFAFSKMNTIYKEAFQEGYRICLRNKKEALNFLQERFKNYKFGDTFSILDSMYEYSKDDCVRILEANKRTMEEEVLNEQRKKAFSKFAYAQISVAIPFLSVVFLGAVPVLYYGISMMRSVVDGF